MTALFTRILLCLTLAMPSAGIAQDGALRTLATADAARGWLAVGRVEIMGRGFCTGTLIDADLVLTAAHCLTDPATRRPLPASLIEFRAGWRNGRAEAYRGVRAVAIHPDFDGSEPGDTPEPRVAHDLAILRLDRPIRLPGLSAPPQGDAPGEGAAVALVSYAEDRAEAPALQDRCALLRRVGRMLVLSCDVSFGSSGAPVLARGASGLEVVAVVSAVAEMGGRPVALAAPVEGQIETLRGAFGPADRGATGARFIRP